MLRPTASGLRASRWRPLLAVAAVAYAAALATVLLWPVHVDGDGGFIRFDAVISLLDGIGMPRRMSAPSVEFAANTVLFAPLGMLWAAIRPGPAVRSALAGGLLGAMLSFGAEVAQGLFILERTFDSRDVLANALGTSVGVLVTAVAFRSSPLPPDAA